MGDPADDVPPEWLTADGEIISPNAPAGGGGQGRFRTSGSLGWYVPLNPALPPANAPSSRNQVPPQPKPPAPKPPNPPPVTVPGTTQLKPLQDKRNDVDVKVEVLADTTGALKDPTGKLNAETSFSTAELEFLYPKYQPFHKVAGRVDDTVDTIMEETTKFIMKGSITIQTRYKPGADPAGPSGYGRGTTDKDKDDRNVSGGFHESCHREDLQTWFQAHPLPVFTGKVGMTVKAYKQAIADHTSAFQKYAAEAKAYTEARTDEVGSPKQSEYLKNQQP